MNDFEYHIDLESLVVLASHVTSALPAFPGINLYPTTGTLPQLSPLTIIRSFTWISSAQANMPAYPGLD